jgi:hypothetical protein
MTQFFQRWHYRRGLSRSEAEVIRQLRAKGFAVAIVGADDVGNPLNRSPVEQAMVKAARVALKRKEGMLG